jgi:hypothetical protein
MVNVVSKFYINLTYSVLGPRQETVTNKRAANYLLMSLRNIYFQSPSLITEGYPNFAVNNIQPFYYYLDSGTLFLRCNTRNGNFEVVTCGETCFSPAMCLQSAK